MIESRHRDLQDLLKKAREGTASRDDYRQIIAMINKDENDEVVDMLNAFYANESAGAVQHIEPYDRVYWQQALVELKESIYEERVASGPVVHRVHFLRMAWFRYAAAVIILFGVGAYLWNQNLKFKSENSKTVKVVPVQEILPGGDKAILTLSDGRHVELNAAASEKIQDGTLSIENNEGALSYAAMPSSSDAPRGARPRSSDEGIAFNTMTTPKGGQYKLILADGTRVWLNAASSVTYPTVFNGKTRTVSISGEVYFEVAKNSKQAFIVETPKEEITVLGTAFNVNAYPDEESKTSLVEGAVKVVATSREIILEPGQAFRNGKIISTNLSEDLAWKNGYFHMRSASIESIMRTLSRWYDIDVEYARVIPGTFTIEISRNTNLSDVLKILEETGEVTPEIKGRTLVIK